MPIPSPKKGEEQDKFISRCMANDVMCREYSDASQRAAVCHSQWRRQKKSEEQDWGSKSNFHSARLTDPDKYDDWAYDRDKLGKGIDVVYGIITKPERRSEIQAVRFDAGKFTTEEARAWLKKHKIKYLSFTPVTKGEAVQKSWVDPFDEDWHITYEYKRMRPPIGCPGGKVMMVSKLLPLIPEHKVYTEAFLGSGALFWAKQPAAKAIMSDVSREIITMFQLLQSFTPAEKTRLEQLDWNRTRDNFKRAKTMEPKDRVEKTWKYITEIGSTYGGKRRHGDFMGGRGSWKAIKFLDRFKDRLHNATIKLQDWKATVLENDSPDTFHFIDPPYTEDIPDLIGPGQKPLLGHVPVLEVRNVVRRLKGNWILTLADSVRNREVFKEFTIRTIETQKLMAKRKPGDRGKFRTELLISNFLEADKQQRVALTMEFREKRAVQHIVGGIVYYADTPDTDAEWAEAEENWEAMVDFMIRGPVMSIKHKTEIDARVVECFQAEADTQKGGGVVPKGAIWMSVKVLDNATWDLIEKGEIRGFSWDGFVQVERGVAPNAGDHENQENAVATS